MAAVQEAECADAEKAAASKRRSAFSTSSESSRRSYLRDAERKADDANRARSAAATYSGKVADAQVKVHKAQADLDKARAAEERKRASQAERDRKKQETGERRQREHVARVARDAARERERADAARDAQVTDLGSDLFFARHDASFARAVVEARPWENVPQRITVLILTAEPDGEARLRIDRELREIQEQVRSSALRDSIAFQHRHAVRFGDLIQHLNETEPDVIHFSGHGSRGGIALHADDDTTRDLTNEELDQVLGVAPKPLKLVVFNSCNSAAQARVAGLSRSCGDRDGRDDRG